MNWDQLAGKWKQSIGKVKENWGKLNDDDLQVAAGTREQFVGLLQERYGIAKEEAEEQVDDFMKSLESGAKERFDRAAAGTGRRR